MPRFVRTASCIAAFTLITLFDASAADGISKVAVSRMAINQAIGQRTTIEANVVSEGTVGAAILDRDGIPVRRFPAVPATPSMPGVFEWDGSDDEGIPVPDEAYSVRITYEGVAGHDEYFPANQLASHFEVGPAMFDRANGTLGYTLPRAARVHVQAGAAVRDSNGDMIGPVLATVVNRQPRPAGAILEHWRGFDTSGRIYIPDQPNFVVGIVATPLPENAILVTGSPRASFLEELGNRRGASLITKTPHHHQHHAGLSTRDDVSPDARLLPLDGRLSSDGVYEVGREVEIAVALAGPTSQWFVKHPAKVFVFVDSTPSATYDASESLRIPLVLDEGHHVIAVNWASEYGPVAVGAVRVRSIH